VQLVTTAVKLLAAPMKLVTVPMQFLTLTMQTPLVPMKLVTVAVKLATVQLKLVTKRLTFTTPVYDHPSQKGGELNKKPGPAERRAKVKACGQKHRSALSFCILFYQEKSMNKIRPLTFLIKQKGKRSKKENQSKNYLPKSSCTRTISASFDG
jgi:hypothetical protein